MMHRSLTIPCPKCAEQARMWTHCTYSGKVAVSTIGDIRGLLSLTRQGCGPLEVEIPFLCKEFCYSHGSTD